MQPTKVTMTLWVRWKKPGKLFFTVDPEDVDGAEDLESLSDKDIKVEMPLKILMTEIFEGSNTEKLVQHMITHIKT